MTFIAYPLAIFKLAGKKAKLQKKNTSTPIQVIQIDATSEDDKQAEEKQSKTNKVSSGKGKFISYTYRLSL